MTLSQLITGFAFYGSSPFKTTNLIFLSSPEQWYETTRDFEASTDQIRKFAPLVVTVPFGDLLLASRWAENYNLV